MAKQNGWGSPCVYVSWYKARLKRTPLRVMDWNQTQQEKIIGILK